MGWWPGLASGDLPSVWFWSFVLGIVIESRHRDGEWCCVGISKASRLSLGDDRDAWIVPSIVVILDWREVLCGSAASIWILRPVSCVQISVTRRLYLNGQRVSRWKALPAT